MPGSASWWVFAILPEGFGLPGPVYWVPILLGLIGVSGILYLFEPSISDSTVPALSPWIAFGASLYVMRIQGLFPDGIDPLFGTPMVYLTTAFFLVIVWTISELVAGMRPPGASSDRQMAAVGIFLTISGGGISLAAGARGPPTLGPLLPGFGLLLTAVLTGLVWIGIGLAFTETATLAGRTGVVVVFGHVIDGVSTMIGSDLFPHEINERTPLSEAILRIGDQIPVISGGFLFLLVKVLLVVAVLVAFRDYIEERPTRARLVLGFVAAVGLGPGFHNLLLFTVWEQIQTVQSALLVPV